MHSCLFLLLSIEAPFPTGKTRVATVLWSTHHIRLLASREIWVWLSDEPRVRVCGDYSRSLLSREALKDDLCLVRDAQVWCCRGVSGSACRKPLCTCSTTQRSACARPESLHCAVGGRVGGNACGVSLEVVAIGSLRCWKLLRAWHNCQNPTLSARLR